jgi:ribulose 1,5-bisphosphate synthetase/thiazole synthase
LRVLRFRCFNEGLSRIKVSGGTIWVGGDRLMQSVVMRPFKFLLFYIEENYENEIEYKKIHIL